MKLCDVALGDSLKRQSEQQALKEKLQQEYERTRSEFELSLMGALKRNFGDVIPSNLSIEVHRASYLDSWIVAQAHFNLDSIRFRGECREYRYYYPQKKRWLFYALTETTNKGIFRTRTTKQEYLIRRPADLVKYGLC